jgi:hypothetical protein
MDWIYLVQGRDRGKAVMNTVMKLRVPRGIELLCSRARCWTCPVVILVWSNMELTAVANRPRSRSVCVSLTSGGNTYRINVRHCCVTRNRAFRRKIVAHTWLLFAHSCLVLSKVNSWRDYVLDDPSSIYDRGREFFFAFKSRLIKFDLRFAYARADKSQY